MRALAFLTLAGFVALAGQTPPAAAADDKDNLQGKWKVSKLELPPDLAEAQAFADAIAKEIDFVVKDDVITATVPKEKEPGKATFKLDPTKTPKQIDITDATGKSKETIQAIYKFDGDTLLVAMPTDKSVPRPTEFKASGKKTDKGQVVVLHLKKAK